MAIERRAVKKRILKSGKDRTDTAVYVLLKYGVTDDADVAQKLVQSNDEVLFPSDLSYYTDQVDQDLGMGKTSPEVEKIRNALAEFYGLYEPEQETEEEIPSELDDLLGSIREEDLEEPSAPPSSALAIYEGVGGEDIVEEDIDERILKLLKLDGVYDIDYATYMTLLKERMVAARMADSSISTEEDELLRDEFKRVKGKVGRFKLKKKRITAEDMGTTGPVTVSDDQFFLTSSAVIPKKSADPEAEGDDSEVLKKLDDILSSLRMENKEEKDKTRSDKKDAAEEKRRAREKKLESGKRKEFKNLINNVIAPVTNILQDIINWFKWTFIGFVFNQVLGWFQDPENKKKVEALSAFVKAFWPAILAAAVLFLTPFGAFIRSTIKLLRWAIPKMFGIIKKHPKIAAAAALFGAGLLVPQFFPETVNEQERKTKEAEGTKEEKIAALKKQKENLNPLQIIQGVGSEIDDQIKFLETGKTAQYGASPLNSNNSALKLDDENADLSEMPDVLSQFQDIEGMSGGGLVGDTIINTYSNGGLIQNTGGQFNNVNTLGSEGAFNPIFGFTGGGINLPNVNIPSMKTNISLMSGGGATTNTTGSSRSMLNVNDIRFSGGGGVTGDSGVDVTGAGPDTQLVALQPGEIVMSKGAVNHWGANTLLGMNKAGGGTNVPKMANNIQMATGGGMVGSPLSGGGTTSLDPTKTAASMPHVFAAAKAARAKARAEGLPPEEVEKRVVAASEKAKASGPSALPKGPGYDAPNGTPHHEPIQYPPAVKDADSTTPTPTSSVPAPVEPGVKGSMPSTPFKSERLNKALTGITADSWKKSIPSATSASTTETSASVSEAEKIESVEPGSKVVSKSAAMTNPLTSELVMGGGEKTTPAEFKNKSGMDYSSAIKISSIASGSKSLKNSVPSTMTPVATPSRNYQPKIINLPTKTTTQQGPPPDSVSSSPDIPKFSSSRASEKRQSTLVALGINDLVG